MPEAHNWVQELSMSFKAQQVASSISGIRIQLQSADLV